MTTMWSIRSSPLLFVVEPQPANSVSPIQTRAVGKNPQPSFDVTVDALSSPSLTSPCILPRRPRGSTNRAVGTRASRAMVHFDGGDRTRTESARVLTDPLTFTIRGGIPMAIKPGDKLPEGTLTEMI